MATCSVDPTHPVVGQAGGPNYWCPKLLREYLCKQQTYVPDMLTSNAILDLIRIIDLHRPLGVDGKHHATGAHGDLHTPTCGCDR